MSSSNFAEIVLNGIGLPLEVDGQQLAYASLVDNNGIRTVRMALVDDAVEVGNEILF